MKLLIILLTLAAERYIDGLEHFRSTLWYKRWESMILDRIKQPKLVLLLICVAPLPILIALFHSTIRSHVLAMATYSFVDLILLLFFIGPTSFFDFKSAGKKKFNAEEYFQKINAQWFAPLLWYIFCGTEMVVLYWLLIQASTNSKIGSLAKEGLAYMDWFPARLMALVFMLAGNLQNAMAYFVNYAFSGVQNNKLVLTGCAIRAMKCDEDNYSSAIHAQDLVWRAMILVVTGVALSRISPL